MKSLYLVILLFCFCSCKKAVDELPSTETLDVSGVWNLKSACTAISGAYAKIGYTFTDTAYTQTVLVYPNSSCTGLLLTMKISASYIISNVYRTSYELRGDFDETLSGYTISVTDPSVLTNYNSSSMCGYNNWATNIPKNILGRVCNSASIPPAGTTNYNLISNVFATLTIGPTGTPPMYTAGDLYLGTSSSGHNGTTPAQRYTTGDLNFIYVNH